MAKYFLETSAFVKRYKKEVGSDFVNQLFCETNDLFYLNLAPFEIRKVFYRLYLWPQNLEGDVQITKNKFQGYMAQLAADFTAMHRVDLTDEMMKKSAEILERVWLKSVFDLAYLSGFLIAKEVYPDLIFVCSDKSNLVEAAKNFIKEKDVKIPEQES